MGGFPWRHFPFQTSSRCLPVSLVPPVSLLVGFPDKLTSKGQVRQKPLPARFRVSGAPAVAASDAALWEFNLQPGSGCGAVKSSQTPSWSKGLVGMENP